MGVNYSHYLIPRDNTVRPEPERIVALIEVWCEKGYIVCPEAASVQKATDRVSQSAASFLTKSAYGEHSVEQRRAPEPRPGFWGRLLAGARKAPGQAQAASRRTPWMPFSIPPTGEALSALANPYTLIRWEGDQRATYPMQTLSESVYEGNRQFRHSLLLEISDDFINPRTDNYGVARQIGTECSCGNDLGYDDGRGWLATSKIRRTCPACGRTFCPRDRIAEIVDGASGNTSPQAGGLCNRFGIIIGFGREMPLYVPDLKGQLIEATPRVTEDFLYTCAAALDTELSEFDYYS
ncbi:hypothetical protein IC762_31155 [Bradyrhizobium genosp. L]|uniref:hypothetical protein n=1 Tax=Bradyrhizobium genosp. L TaxID=83637 RepID=UPI0018A2D536|nr:hypothetical protein [Bradyrhizobium genosp. L]QPF84043.1 hypothetical protein IC762_31155 [Bradyrhizobium genosp. L]